MYSLKFNLNSEDTRRIYAKIYEYSKKAHNRLDNRLQYSISDYLKALKSRETLIKNQGSFLKYK